MLNYWVGSVPTWIPAGYQIPPHLHGSAQQFSMQAQNIYYQFESDRRGVLRKKEFKMALQHLGVSKPEAKHLFKMIDRDHNKLVSMIEFINAYLFFMSGGMGFSGTGYNYQFQIENPTVPPYNPNVNVTVPFSQVTISQNQTFPQVTISQMYPTNLNISNYNPQQPTFIPQQPNVNFNVYLQQTPTVIYQQPIMYQQSTNIQVAPGVLTGVDYRIKSHRYNTVLDDWGGKTGEGSAALQSDTHPNSPNRLWRLIPVQSKPGWYRIKNIAHGTVLDSWGGKTGENSAALQPDTHPESDNRIFQIIPMFGHFIIKSTMGTVLDSWGGKVGEDSAAFMQDDFKTDYLNSNRLWDFIPAGQP